MFTTQFVETIEGLEVLNDISPSEKKRDWRGKKIKNDLLRLGYSTLSLETADVSMSEYYYKKALRLEKCASFLIFNEYLIKYLTNDGRLLKAKQINSCRVRLCPICTWRRSMKIYSQFRSVVDSMQSESEYAYIFVTLTVPNVTGEELNDEITNLMTAWKNLQRYPKYKKAIKGGYRALEITHNVKYSCQNFDTYHPHFHCVFAVNKSYFTDKTYIKRDEWLEMWKKATHNSKITQVDVRRVKPKGNASDITGAICEVAKYTVKDDDYIIADDWDLSCSAIEVLDKALTNRRLVSFFGVMKDFHKKLNLDDPIDGDLLEDGQGAVGELIRERTFFWHWGYQQYLSRD